MIRPKTTVIAVITLAISYFVAQCTKLDVLAFLSDVLLPFGGALTGIVLATVAIIMGSVGTTYAAVAARRDLANKEALNTAFAALDTMVSELKHDCVMVIICFGVLLGTYLSVEADLPCVALPSNEYLSKEILLATASLSACIFSFVAMVDTVGAVFRMHDQTATIAKGS